MQRQHAIHEKFKIKCECVACVNDYPSLCQQKISTTDGGDTFKFGRFGVTTDIEAFNMYRKNCKYIQDNFNDFPCRSISRRLIHNTFLFVDMKKDI